MRIGKRCYVGNLAWRTSWQDLKDQFREVGVVVYANVVKDDTGRSKGWGIVEFETPEEAVQAVQTLNGVELGGRKILVREDREDRDVKQYNRDNGLEGEGQRQPRPRRDRRARGGRDGDGEEGGRGGGRDGGGRGRGRGRGDYQQQMQQQQSSGQSSGLQVVVQGLPWAYTQEQLSPMFQQFGNIVSAEVVYGRDGRSRGYGTVRFETQEAVQAAIQQLHGSDLEGRTLTVRLDKFA
jgi:RNA recognition motif-containing protein